jgi:predicted RNA-binding Zn-ribbon protein involved in translation (DUF1610 family)
MRFTPEVRAALLLQGETEESIAKIEADWTHEASCLDRCECPKCGSQLERKIDSRQAGATCAVPEPYVWVNYNCTACSYHVDRAEHVADDGSRMPS